MKLVCIKDTQEIGIIWKEKKKQLLTVGKIYKAYPITVHKFECASMRDVYFLVFNDKKEWEPFPLNMFIPYEEE